MLWIVTEFMHGSKGAQWGTWTVILKCVKLTVDFYVCKLYANAQ